MEVYFLMIYRALVMRRTGGSVPHILQTITVDILRMLQLAPREETSPRIDLMMHAAS
uniref:Uncharacterized protein n=1 Tax=Amphimedon queenslandica TaxID=400682 RepID=A0A1X7SNX4_AMPQE